MVNRQQFLVQRVAICSQ